MRPKRPNAMLRACALLCLAVLSVMALTAASAFALSPERHYEMVSPVYKEGYGVGETIAAEPEGNSFVFESKGGFAGPLSGGAYSSHYYLARRGETGWSTVAFEPEFGALSDVSANLEYGLGSGLLSPNAGAENYANKEQAFQLHRSDAPDTAASWEAFGGIVMERLDKGNLVAPEQGASPDLCHVVVGHAQGALLPGAIGMTFGAEPIYDLSRGCGGGEPYLRLIGVKNDEASSPINRSCSVELGTGDYIDTPGGLGQNEQRSEVGAVDAHGDEIFFTTNVQEGSNAINGCYQSGAHQQLFVRVGGARTIEVSRPLEGGPYGGCVAGGVPGEVPCEGALSRASAYFKGASEDGSRVFFTTRAPLVSGDEDAGNDLYMASIGCPVSEPGCEASKREVTGLVQVSHDPVASHAAEVQGVLNVARDGSHVYFVARGALTSEGPAGEGVQSQPVAGADNLYVYDSVSGKTVFVADLCSGPSRSGVVADGRCPRGLQEGEGEANDRALLWEGQSMAQSTPDGAFLVFATYGQLVGGDTDSAKDVYRYDAQTGALERVSIGEDGYDANGNNSAFDANSGLGSMGRIQDLVHFQQEMAARAVSKDGSRIVFSTADPLSPAATNGRVNIYEWHEGSVSLISSGTSEENDENATITASGRDIFFTTSQGLVRQDTDGLPDLYDARLGGGFAVAAAPVEPCEGDACQGPLTNPAPLLVPGSVSQAPGGNFAAPVPAVKAKPKAKVKKRPKPKRKTKKKAKKSNRRVS